MPVFRNETRNLYALVSYKSLYSKFSQAPEWQELGLYPTPRLVGKAFLKDNTLSTFIPIRSPFSRTVSCFTDKFRKQPTRIYEPRFELQACHNWPTCTVIRIEDTDALAEIPDIDWSIKTNISSHIQQDFELKEEHKVQIRQLYKSDFVLGGYSFRE